MHKYYSQGDASVHVRLKCERCAIDVRSLFDYRTDNERTTNGQRTNNERTTSEGRAKEERGKSESRASVLLHNVPRSALSRVVKEVVKEFITRDKVPRNTSWEIHYEILHDMFIH